MLMRRYGNFILYQNFRNNFFGGISPPPEFKMLLC